MTTWRCQKNNDSIDVYADSNLEGQYNLLKEPYCYICASPGVTISQCSRDHSKDYFDKVTSLGIYYQQHFRKGDLLSAHILKLKGDRTYADPIGKGMAIVAREVFPDLMGYDAIVPVPLYIAEFAIRGYNQALEIAKILRQETGIPIIWALQKTRMHTQRTLNYSNRREAVESLYKVVNQNNVEGKRLIIVDDVFTSGATCSESARILKSANAKSVRVFVAGRANFVQGNNH
jgi:ComF family protein